MKQILFILFAFLSAAALSFGCGSSASVTPENCVDSPFPTNVAVVSTDSKNAITWDNICDADTYNLYWTQTDDTTTEKIENATNPYEHTNLTNGETYEYTVTPVGESGEEGEASATVSGTPSISLDTTLGSGNGYIIYNSDENDYPYDVKTLSVDDEIKTVVSGTIGDSPNQRMFLRMFGDDGTLEWSVTGDTNTKAGKMAIDSRDRILVAGGDVCVDPGPSCPSLKIRCYTPAGAACADFGSNGSVEYNTDSELGYFLQGFGIAVHTDSSGQESIYVVNAVDGSGIVIIVKFDMSGNRDTGYLLNYLSGETYSPWGIVVDSDGRALVAGTNDTGGSMFVLRATAAGALDASFGSGGVFEYKGNGNNWGAYGIAIDSSGRIIVSGSDAQHTILLCLDSSGALCSDFASGGVSTTSNMGSERRLTIDSYGRILVTGSGKSAADDPSTAGLSLERFNGNAAPETKFGSNGMFVERVGAINSGIEVCNLGTGVTVDSSDRIIVVGRSCSAGTSEECTNIDLTIWRYK